MKYTVMVSYVLTSALLASLGAATSRADVIYNAENQPISISNLMIDDDRYNVTFQYDTAFDVAYPGFPATAVPAFWGDRSGALSAVEAIAIELNAGGVLPNANTMIAVPTASGTWTFGDYVDAVIAEFSVGDSSYAFSGPFESIRADFHVGDATLAWSTLVAVPEPTSLGLGSVLMAVVAYSRRRRFAVRPQA